MKIFLKLLEILYILLFAMIISIPIGGILHFIELHYLSIIYDNNLEIINSIYHAKNKFGVEEFKILCITFIISLNITFFLIKKINRSSEKNQINIKKKSNNKDSTIDKVPVAKHNCLSGRITREKYIFTVLPLLLFISSIFSLRKKLALHAPSFSWERHEVWLNIYISIIVAIILIFIQTIKRLHDTNRSNWYAIVLLIPFINDILLLTLSLENGTPSRNKYGENPKTRHN